MLVLLGVAAIIRARGGFAMGFARSSFCTIVERHASRSTQRREKHDGFKYARSRALTTAIVHPFDPGAPTGLHALVRQLAEALIARGERVRLVLGKPVGGAAVSDGEALESCEGLGAGLELRWLPVDTFDPTARHRLSFALERMADDTARWVCFGVGSCGFVGSLVARQASVPCTTLVASRDVLGRMMMHPDEVAGALARSTRVFCSNPALVDVMAAFHPSEVAALLREARLEIARPTSAVSTDAHVAMADHVCTTGALGLFEDLAELSARVVAEMRATGATRWLHVGTVHPRTVAPLASALAMRGLTSAFDAIGRCDALEYERSVRSSLVLLKPRGEVDTAISVVEARRWGVRVSLPVDFPFSTDGDARLTGAATRLGVIDSTELAARVLER